MNHRQEIQSTALEIVNITEWIITITEQIVPITQQIESMTEWILNITEEIIGIPQNIVLVWQRIIPIWQEIMGYTDYIVPIWKKITPIRENIMAMYVNSKCFLPTWHLIAAIHFTYLWHLLSDNVKFANHFLSLAKIEDDSLSNKLMTTKHYITNNLLISIFPCSATCYR